MSQTRDMGHLVRGGFAALGPVLSWGLHAV